MKSLTQDERDFFHRRQEVDREMSPYLQQLRQKAIKGDRKLRKKIKSYWPVVQVTFFSAFALYLGINLIVWWLK